MGSVRFVHVPHEEKDELPLLFKLDPSTYGRIPSNLLDEAVRFYNYPAVGLYATATDWPVFSEKNISKAIESLHDALKTGIISMVDNLYKEIKQHVSKDKCGQLNWSHGEKGAMCAKLLVSTECRSNKKEALLEKKPKEVHFREFEKLIPALWMLRACVYEKKMEGVFEKTYSNNIIGIAEVRQALFKPQWGGSWIVKPKKDIWASSDRIWSPEEPIWPYARSEVGPTEKLYFSLSADVFKKQQNISFNSSKNHFARTNDHFLKNVYELSKTIWQIMPPYDPKDKRIIKWKEWQRNLEHLAYVFAKAILEVKQEAWVERKEEAWISWIKIDDCGVRVGLPAALGLIGILYAYITDLMARTVMGALSSAIIDIYEETNGYTAVGLYEALSRKGSIAPVGPETVLDKKLVGVLGQWRTVPAADVKEVNPWEDAEVDILARERFDKLFNSYLIPQERWKKTLSYKKQKKDIGEGMSFDDFHNSYIPRFPVITKGFYENLSLPKEQIHGKEFNLDDRYADENLYGATFESQVHLFIAFQMLEKSKEVLKWNWESEKYKYKQDTKVLNKKRYPCFFIGAGSFVFGGRKPPHKTHRYGVNFDFNFGPTLVSWPKSTITDYIVKLRRDKKGKEWLEAFVKTDKRKKFLIWDDPRVHAICYTKAQENKKQAAMVNRPRMVFRAPVRDELVNVLIKKVKEFCPSKSKDIPYYSKYEESEYLKAEAKLAGTPHFIRPDDATSLKIKDEERTELADWQRTHAGHLSILLSAPKLIVYASPIVHFRASHAIRQSLKKEGIPIFKFECSDEHIDYFNNPEKYQSTLQDLMNIFRSNGIPLDPNHCVESKNSEWVLASYGDEFRLNELDNHIYVSYLIPKELVAAFSDVINLAGFSFMPDDHHHHWHVDYDSNRLNRHRYLWLSMQVDLKGFEKYLSTYKVNQNSLSKSVDEERKKILNWCNDYVKEFEQRYGGQGKPPDDKQLQKITISNELLKAIFGVYRNSDSSFIRPGVTLKNVSQSNQDNMQALFSDELEEQIKSSEKLLFGRDGLVQQLFIRGMLKKSELDFVEWSVHFVREQEPADIRRLMEDGYEEPDLEDYEIESANA
jgi:hypothetical protein